MKKIIFTTIISLIFSFAIAQNQNIFLVQGLSNDDKSLVDKAKSDILRGDRLLNNSQNVYNQYKNLLESPKRHRRRRGERKSIGGKKLAIQAAIYYNRGFQQLFEVYYNYASQLQYDIPQNAQKAKQLRQQAENYYNKGIKTFATIKDYASLSDKKLAKNIHFKDLLNQLKTAKQQTYKAVSLLIQAINLFYKEEQQRQQMAKKDDQAWQNALNQNTIQAYQQYLNQFPNGRHVSEAKAKITALQQQQISSDSTFITQNQTFNSNSNLIYRVQILADKRPWTKAQIRKKIYKYYCISEPCFQTVINGWYKYYIGKYTTYQKAKIAAENLRITLKTKPFVQAFLNGNPINIKQALQIEKQNH